MLVEVSLALRKPNRTVHGPDEGLVRSAEVIRHYLANILRHRVSLGSSGTWNVCYKPFGLVEPKNQTSRRDDIMLAVHRYFVFSY